MSRQVLYMSQIADLRYSLHPELHGNGSSTMSTAASGLDGMGATTPLLHHHPHGSMPRALGLGFRVQGSGFRVQGSGFRVQGLGFRV